MDFDLKGAREAGYSDTEIADALAPRLSFDLQGARQAGYRDSDIVNALTATPTITDYGKSLFGGVASGVGMIFQGGGEVLARGANRLLGTELRAENPLQGAVDWLERSRTPAARRAIAETQITGSLFEPDTWDFGANPSLSGLALQGVNVIGQFAPNLAVALATAGASIPVQLTTGAVVGGLQALGGGAGEERERFSAMSHEELMSGSGLYRELVGRGVQFDAAKAAVAEAAALGGGIGNAIPSAAEGAFENFLIGALTRGRLTIPGRGIVGKALVGGGAGAVLGGTEEAIEYMGQNIGANMAIRGDRPVTQGTLQEFVLGAFGEASFGAAGGAITGVLERGVPDDTIERLRRGEEAAKAAAGKIIAAPSADAAIQEALAASDRAPEPGTATAQVLTKEMRDAIRQPSAEGGVLRPGRPEVGLPQVGEAYPGQEIAEGAAAPLARPGERRAEVRPGGPPPLITELDVEANEAAPSPLNARPEPTQAQAEAGNYKKGHVDVWGMDVSIENPAGSIRRDSKNVPPKWEVEQKDHYGYIRGTKGFDKDHLDAFIKVGTGYGFNKTVYVVNQSKADGSFDEHKSMIGYASQEEARQAYLRNYDNREMAERRIRSIVALPMEKFKNWAFSQTRGPQTGELILPVTHYIDEAKILVRVLKPGETAPEGARTFTDFDSARTARIETLRKKARMKKRINTDTDSLIPAIVKLGGLSMEERNDVIGDKGNVAISGVGFLFKQQGTGMDDMARLLEQYGYMTKREIEDPGDTGGTRLLADRIRAEFDRGKKHYSVTRDLAKVQAEEEAVIGEDLGSPFAQQEAAEAQELEVAAGPAPEDWTTLTPEEQDAQLDAAFPTQEAIPPRPGEGEAAPEGPLGPGIRPAEQPAGPREREPGEDDEGPVGPKAARGPVLETRQRWLDAQEYEGRLFGGAYSANRLLRAAKDAPIREMVRVARARYNALRKAFGIEEVSDWTQRPEQLVQHLPDPGKEPQAARGRGVREEIVGRTADLLTGEQPKAPAPAAAEQPLFIPLKSDYYDAFERGEKDTEYREYGARWNEKTARVGRKVVLSKGYGNKHRLTGTIIGFKRGAPPADPAFRAIYGDEAKEAAQIQIRVDRPEFDRQGAAERVAVKRAERVRQQAELLGEKPKEALQRKVIGPEPPLLAAPEGTAPPRELKPQPTQQEGFFRGEEKPKAARGPGQGEVTATTGVVTWKRTHGKPSLGYVGDKHVITVTRISEKRVMAEWVNRTWRGGEESKDFNNFASAAIAVEEDLAPPSATPVFAPHEMDENRLAERPEDVKWFQALDYYAANINTRRALIVKHGKAAEEEGATLSPFQVVVGGDTRHLENQGKAQTLEDAKRIAFEGASLPLPEPEESPDTLRARERLGRKSKAQLKAERRAGRWLTEDRRVGIVELWQEERGQPRIGYISGEEVARITRKTGDERQQLVLSITGWEWADGTEGKVFFSKEAATEAADKILSAEQPQAARGPSMERRLDLRLAMRPADRPGGGSSGSLRSAIATLNNILPWYEARGDAAAEQTRILQRMRKDFQHLLDNPKELYYEPLVPIERGLLEAFKHNQRLLAAGRMLEAPFGLDPNMRWPEKWFNWLYDKHGEKWLAAARAALTEMEASVREGGDLRIQPSDVRYENKADAARARHLMHTRLRRALAKYEKGKAPQAARGRLRSIVVPDAIRRILRANDNLGFDSYGQAANAILQYGDWATRWEIGRTDLIFETEQQARRVIDEMRNVVPEATYWHRSAAEHIVRIPPQAARDAINAWRDGVVAIDELTSARPARGPGLTTLAADVEALESIVDDAYENNSAQAEDLDALLAGLKEELVNAIEQNEAEQELDLAERGEPEEFDFSTLEEELRRAYHEFRTGRMTREQAIERIRTAPEDRFDVARIEPGISDQQIFEAMKDAYATSIALRYRRLTRAQPMYDERKEGPKLFARDVALVQPSEWSYGQPTPGTKYFDNTIVDMRTRRTVGRVTLGWRGGKVTELLNILTLRSQRGKGYAEKTLRAILEHNGEIPVQITAILNSAAGFWRKMGVDFEEGADGEENGTATLESYRAARPGRQGAGPGRAAVQEALPPRRGVPGEGRGPARRARQGLTLPALQQELFQAFGPGVRKLFSSGLIRYARDPRALPARLETAWEPQTRAFYDPAGNGGKGAIWFIGSELSARRAVPILLHELGEHYGLEEMLGSEGYNNLLKAVRSSRSNKMVGQAWDYVVEHYIKRVSPENKLVEGDRIFVSEVIAALGENEEALRLPFFQRMLAAIREFLVRLGLKAGLVGRVSDRDIMLLVTASARRAIAKANEPRPYVVPRGTPETKPEAVRGPGFEPQGEMFGEGREIGPGLVTVEGRNDIASVVKSNIGTLFESERTFNWWHRTIGTQFHKALVSPAFGRVFWEGQAQINDTNRFAAQAEQKAPDVLLRLEAPKELFRRPPKPADLKAAAMALYKGTLWGGPSPIEGKVFTDDELRQMGLTGSSEKPYWKGGGSISVYRQIRAAIDESVETMGKSVIARLARTWDVEVDPEMTLEDVAIVTDEQLKEIRDRINLQLEQTGEELVEEDGAPARETLLGVEPATGERLREPSKRVKLLMQRDAVNQAIVKVQEIAMRSGQLQAAGYMPLMRFGQFWVNVRGAGAEGNLEEKFFGMYETEAERNRAAEALRTEFPGAKITRGMHNELGYRIFKGISPETIQLFADVAGLDDNTLIQKFIQLAASERSALKRLLERKGTPGWSWDIPRVLSQFITSNARAASLNYHHAAMLDAIKDIPDRQGDVGKEAVRLYEYLTDPQEEAPKLRGYLFFHFLGGSVAASIVNMTQPVMISAPYLNQYAGIGEVAKQLARAMGEATRAGVPGDAAGQAMKRAIDEGTVAPHEIYQLMAEARGGVGRSLALRQLTRVWGGFFSLAETWNRRSTFLAAYRIAEKKGIDNPYDFAVRAVQETQFIYNKGNRPQWAKGPIGATIFTFKQFSISYLEFLKRLPMQQRVLALGILVAAAGLQGLPGADDLDDLIDTFGQWMGYATNTKKWKREALEAMGLSKAVADFVLHGTSALPGFPLDVQMRLGLGNLIPGTSLFKPSEAGDKVREVAEVLGPAGGLVQAAGTVARAAFQGDVDEAAKAGLPVALRNIYYAMEILRTGQYRDQRGRRIVDADEWDALVKAVGFNPAHVARESRKISTAMTDVSLQRATEDRIAEKWARGILEKDREGIDEAKEELKAWNERNPELRVRITTAQLMQRVREARRTREERFVRRAAPEIRREIRRELRE